MTTEPDKNKSNIQSMNFEVYSPKATTETIDKTGWLTYGDDNDFPAYLIELKNSSPLHGSLCKSIADIIAGKGLTGPDALNLARLLPKIGSDLKTQGGFYLEVIRSVDNSEVSRVNYLPFVSCRLAVDKESGYVKGIFYSRDWLNTRKKGNEPVFIPLFDERTEQNRGCLIISEPTDGLEHYPKPDYWSAINYIETGRQIALYNVNSFLNGLFPSFVINFRNGVPEPDQKAQILREWERQMSGAKNTGKFIATFNEAGSDTSPLIEAFPMTEANTGYLELAYKQATEQIFIGHRVTTPRIFGIADTGNGLSSNTDEMKVGFSLFNAHMIEPKQRMIEDAFNKIQQFNGLGEVKIIPNTPLDIIAPQQTTETQTAEDVASSALNGAQIASLVEILIQASTGVIPIESAKGVVVASFPTLTDEQINDIFTGIVAGSVSPSEVALSTLRKLETFRSKKSPLDEFIALGEDAPAGYILIDAFETDTDNDEDHDEELRLKLNFVSTGVARPNLPSDQDERIEGKLYITRYRYTGELQDNTRKFCRRMLSADKLYRKEDIEAMETKAVNPKWGPNGIDFYSIWKYKGGGACHHFWQKEVYVSAEGLGIDVNSPNAQNIAVRKAEQKGYKVRNEKLVAQLPIDMPNEGFLPDNPRR